MNPIHQYLLVATGGAIGACFRFGIAELFRKLPATSGADSSVGLPYATMVANFIGCFLIGALLGSGFADKQEWMKLGLGIGFLGALTTFSTFSAETVRQIQEEQWGGCVTNILTSVIGGILLVVLGMALGKRWLG